MMRSWQEAYYVGPDRERYQPDLHDWGPLVVPAGSYFMMGDNRDCSYDGRYWGFLPRQNVRGQPMFIYYSYDPSSWRALPFITQSGHSRELDSQTRNCAISQPLIAQLPSQRRKAAESPCSASAVPGNSAAIT